MRGHGVGESKPRLPGVNYLKGKELEDARIKASMRFGDSSRPDDPGDVGEWEAARAAFKSAETPKDTSKQERRMAASEARSGMGRKKRTKRVKRSKRKTHRR
jgi:hypothetical protein